MCVGVCEGMHTQPCREEELCAGGVVLARRVWGVATPARERKQILCIRAAAQAAEAVTC